MSHLMLIIGTILNSMILVTRRAFVCEACPNLKDFYLSSSYQPAFFIDDDDERVLKEQQSQPQKDIMEKKISQHLKPFKLTYTIYRHGSICRLHSNSATG